MELLRAGIRLTFSSLVWFEFHSSGLGGQDRVLREEFGARFGVCTAGGHWGVLSGLGDKYHLPWQAGLPAPGQVTKGFSPQLLHRNRQWG